MARAITPPSSTTSTLGMHEACHGRRGHGRTGHSGQLDWCGSGPGDGARDAGWEELSRLEPPVVVREVAGSNPVSPPCRQAKSASAEGFRGSTVVLKCPREPREASVTGQRRRAHAEWAARESNALIAAGRRSGLPT